MTDARFQFGAMGYWQADSRPIEFGFRFPGTASMPARGPEAAGRRGGFGAIIRLRREWNTATR
jgi:hypothetical protein